VTVRTRLVLAFAYILVTIIVALSVPLAINLGRRAEAEYKNQVLINVLTTAAKIGRESFANLRQLRATTDEFSRQLGGRVVVTDARGIVLADSDGTAIGTQFNSGKRPEIAAALDPRNATATSEIRHSADTDSDLLVTAAPILDEGLAGSIRLTSDVKDVADAVRRTTIGIAIIGIAGLVAGLLIAFGMAGSLAQPLQRLATTARRLGGGDLAARAGHMRGAREIEDLAGSFDDMADRLERASNAQGEFVANASHQLRTPLTGMKLRLESASDATEDPDVRHQLRAAEREVDRMAETVDRMLVTARHVEQGRPVRVDLADAAQATVERWQARAQGADSTLRATGARAAADVNPADLDQILDNLVDNALAYAPGAIEIETATDDAGPWIAVRDHGPGIPDNDQARVIERFFRGRGSPPGGSGLGLAIAREVAERWDGSLTVASADGGGTRVAAHFPAAENVRS